MKISDIEIDLKEINTIEGRKKAAEAIAADIGLGAVGSEKLHEKLMGMLETLASGRRDEVVLERTAEYLESAGGRLGELVNMFLEMAQTTDNPALIFDMGQWQGGLIYASGICNVTAGAIRERLEMLKAEKVKSSETPTEVPPPPDPEPAQQEAQPS